ncbi:MAG: AI-2E family transporter [Dethiobacter sp.]|nr:AI-2E family transporter [Dethiobacter sp.]
MKDRQWDFAYKLVALLLLVVSVIWFVQKISWVIGLVLISLLIVYSISPLSYYLTKKGMPHLISVLIVYFTLLFIFLLFFYLIIPTLIVELRSMARYLATDYSFVLPQFIAQLEEILINDNLIEALQNLSQELPILLQQAISTATTVTVNFLSGLTDIIIILFLVFYLMRDLEPLRRGVIRLFPPRLQKEATHVLEIIDLKVGSYLRGNFVRCAIVGVMTGIVLAVVGMPFALIFGILAGLLNIIVYVGPYLAGIPAVLLSLTPDTPNIFLIILIYIIIQAVDAFILVPLLLGKATDLRPFTIIISLLIGGQLLGIIGIILAIPVAATLKVVVYHYYLKESRKL